MAHPVEPMDVDSDFDNKENSYHHSNVFPCTEKGYEELDVSELNMKLRYSVTPASSPMSKSYTANCVDNRTYDSTDNFVNVTINENANLTRSLNANLSKNDSVVKALKSLPLQSLPPEYVDSRSTSLLRPIDTIVTPPDNTNGTVTVGGTNDIDENLSVPSSSSSTIQTPNATTPTKEIPKNDGGSPIMRGLKSVLNIMFRSSQSPIPQAENEGFPKQDYSLAEATSAKLDNSNTIMASTPLATHHKKETSTSKKSSPLKDSIVFNDDLEKELEWKDETTILFRDERIPIHKLFFQQVLPNESKQSNYIAKQKEDEDFNSTVEYMDISCNDSILRDKTLSEAQTDGNKIESTIATESDSEFVDCETTFTKDEALVIDPTQDFNVNRDATKNNSKLKQIILNTTQDILDATLSITPEDFTNALFNKTIEIPEIVSVTENHDISVARNISNKLNETVRKETMKLDSNSQQHDQILDTRENTEIVEKIENISIQTKNNEQDILNFTNNHTEPKFIDSIDVKHEMIVNQYNLSSQDLDTTHTDESASFEDNLNITKLIENDFDKKLTSEHNAFRVLGNTDQTNITGSVHTRIGSLNDNEILKILSVNKTPSIHDLTMEASQIIENGPFRGTSEQDNIVKLKECLNESKVTEYTHIDETPIRNQYLVPASENIDATDVTQNEIDVFGNILSKDEISKDDEVSQDDFQSSDNLSSTIQIENLTKGNLHEENTNPRMELQNQAAVDVVENITTLNEYISPDNRNDSILEKNNMITVHEFAVDQCELKNEHHITHIEKNSEKSISSAAVSKECNESGTYFLNEKSIIGLPAEIPLPIDDDIEQEEIAAKLPSDLVDDIKIKPVNTIESESKTIMNCPTGLHETIAIPVCESHGPIVNNEFNDKQNITSSETIPKAVSTPNKSINEKYLYMPTVETTGISHNSENSAILEHVNEVEMPKKIINQVGLAIPQFMDVGESVINIQPLPDVINQTITHGQDNIENGINVSHLEGGNKIKLISYPLEKNFDIEKSEITPLDCENVSVASKIDSNASTEKRTISGGINAIENDTANMCMDDNDSHNQYLNNDFILDSFPKIEKAIIDVQLLNTTVNDNNEKSTETNDKNVDLSENNSPFVFVTAEDLILDEKSLDSKDTDAKHRILMETNDNAEQTILVSIDKLEGNNDGNNKPTLTSENIVGNIDYDEQPFRVCTEKLAENEAIKQPNRSNTNILKTPPASPPIRSKGYNFNFGNTEEEKIRISTEEELEEKRNSNKKPIQDTPEKFVENIDFIEQLTRSNSTIKKSPASPPISSKGYNFNFDEIDDPFASKSEIPISPPPTDANKSNKVNECKKPARIKKDFRRKSQPERKRQFVLNKKLNSTFDSTSDTDANKNPVVIKPHVYNELQDRLTKPVIVIPDTNTVTSESEMHDTLSEYDVMIEKVIIPEPDSNTLFQKPIDMKSIDEKISTDAIDIIKTSAPMDTDTSENPIDLNSLNGKECVDTIIEVKNYSSSEQSANFTPGTSSSDSLKSRNVFNIPEIEDMNFNPFASKYKLQTSPDTSIVVSENNLNVKKNISEPNMLSSDDKIDTELMEKTSSANSSNITSSSKATDEKDATFREVNTEDEDTIEGPFLEAEDLIKEEKMTDLFSGNIHRIEANQEAGEMFIDAEAFEFLLNQNKSNTVINSGKESLFLKFDPLFSKRISSDGVLAALNNLQRKQSTPTKVSKVSPHQAVSPVAGPSNLNTTWNMDINTSEELNDELNISVPKPMMVVPPAVNPSVTPRNKSLTPTRSNRRSIILPSPAMAAIDSIIALSGNNRIHDSTVIHVSREQNEADLALTQLRDLLAEKEMYVYNLRSESQELKDTLSNLESQVKCLEPKNEDKLKKIKYLNAALDEKTKTNKSMADVVEEYERTIASLIAETEQDKKKHAEERIKLISERDEQTAHLASMEVSFSDLHSKYEKSKQVILSCKANEDKYMKSIKDFEENLTKMLNNYELLKQHATTKLNHANQEWEKMNKSHETEMLKLNAMIKRKDLDITSLEESLMQKTKANEELTAICDELINKVGGANLRNL